MGKEKLDKEKLIKCIQKLILSAEEDSEDNVYAKGELIALRHLFEVIESGRFD